MFKGTRIIYSEFLLFLKDANIIDYTRKFRYPILLGTEIIEGAIAEKSPGYNATFRFKADTQTSAIETNSIKKMMFTLCKPIDSLTLTNIFSIGRDASNDIVIVDYTVSKKHGEIRYGDNGYVLIDLKSRNGSKLNTAPLPPYIQSPIKQRDILSFGRLSFILLKPISLFVSNRIQTNQEHLLHRDAKSIVNQSDFTMLTRLAKKHHLPYKNQPKETLMHIILKELQPIPILYYLCP